MTQIHKEESPKTKFACKHCGVILGFQEGRVLDMLTVKLVGGKCVFRCWKCNGRDTFEPRKVKL